MSPVIEITQMMLCDGEKRTCEIASLCTFRDFIRRMLLLVTCMKRTIPFAKPTANTVVGGCGVVWLVIIVVVSSSFKGAICI